MTDPINEMKRQAEAAGRAENPREHLQRLQQQAQRLVASANELRDKNHGGEDDTGAVQISVNGSGRVTALKITARGMQQHDHESLGQAVVAAYQTAMLDMAASVKDSIRAQFGVTVDDAQNIDIDAILTKGMHEKGTS